MKDVFTFTSSALPEDLRVVGFRGTEALSQPYELEIYLSLASEEGRELDLADAVGAKATLTLDRDDGRPPQRFHGVLCDLELVHELGDRALTRVVLVPQLWQLTLTQHSRVFTNQSVPDILKAVLESAGFTADDYVFKLSQDYRPLEHVCQYQESHLDFISRWMEREGIYYYFEQLEDRERLILTDSKSFHRALLPASIRFFSLTGADATAKECLQTFTCRHRSLPAHVRMRDYDSTKPTLDVSGSARVSRTGLGEIRHHGAGFSTPDEGKRLSTLRAEELRAREVVYRGTGTTFYLRPGYTFKLEDHPRASFDTTYLTIALEHYGNQSASTPELRRLTGLDLDEVYRVDLRALPEPVQFRPERRTPWPRIYGYEAAIIDGELDSDYAQLDDHGRYRVKLMFDESDLKDGKASTWVRMLQPHGGEVEGWHFPLRKGTEVLLTFLGGDPDRPVIAGVVPNAHTPSPVTRANPTKNVIQTGGRNRLELEDKAGAQRITMSTPYANTLIRMGSPNEQHELIVHTDENTILDTGRRWDIRVGTVKSEIVDGNVFETYKAFKQEDVPNDNVVETYKGHNTTVHTVRKQEYAQQDKLVKGLLKEQIGIHEVTVTGGGRKEEITGGLEQTVSGGPGASETINGNKTTTVHGNWVRTVDGTISETALGPSTHFKLDNHALVVAGVASDTFLSAKNTNFIGGQFNFTFAQLVNIKASGDLNLSIGTSLTIDYVLKQTMTPIRIRVANLKIGTTQGVDLSTAPLILTRAGTMVIS